MPGPFGEQLHRCRRALVLRPGGRAREPAAAAACIVLPPPARWVLGWWSGSSDHQRPIAALRTARSPRLAHARSYRVPAATADGPAPRPVTRRPKGPAPAAPAVRLRPLSRLGLDPVLRPVPQATPRLRTRTPPAWPLPASLVFPTPPGPVTVTRRPLVTRSVSLRTSSARPTKLVAEVLNRAS